MNFKSTIEQIMQGYHLSASEAFSVMSKLGDGAYNDSQKTALIIALSSRDLSLEEIAGFRNALLELSVKTTLTSYNAIDLCGTGGDEKNTFNISTLASFVVAAAGYKVAKHGNYGVSSVSGSSNVLEKLGYKFSADSSKLERELNELNICFLHAPLFHPALKNVSDTRKQLGIKTIFNSLGPLVNPARTKKQFVGVYNLKLARLYHYLLQQDAKDYVVVHALDGYDEISLTSSVQYFSSTGEQLLEPSDFGLGINTQQQLYGGETLDDALVIFKKVIANEGTAVQTNAVLANAAAGIQCFENNKSLPECVAIAKEAIVSGKANQLLKKLIEIQ
ncbi:MAG: anthranilate phosphoribosyltransferase [Flavobacteriales bacterium]|nr:anthranilate phosphoribosyltransferase [Flavobacteriales bacterium]MCB9173511.1 anthranilate phosphoribosyltransferase [Flavobacteriales bacterium]